MMDLGEAAKTLSGHLSPGISDPGLPITHSHSHHTPHRACPQEVVGNPEVDPVVSGLCNQLVKAGGERS